MPGSLAKRTTPLSSSSLSQSQSQSVNVSFRGSSPHLIARQTSHLQYTDESVWLNAREPGTGNNPTILIKPKPKPTPKREPEPESWDEATEEN